MRIDFGVNDGAEVGGVERPWESNEIKVGHLYCLIASGHI